MTTTASLDVPALLARLTLEEKASLCYRGYDARRQEVSYPFGHGLSYTRFTYSDLDVTAEPGGERVRVAVTVTNSGERVGKEVVQVYVSDPVAAVARPERELKAFCKIALEPGESRRVDLALTGRDLSYFHPGRGRWLLEGGRFSVSVGASSRDLRLSAEVEVDTPPHPPVLTDDSTLDEWLAHPVAGPLLEERIAAAGPSRLTDPEMRRLLGNFPLLRLTSFPEAPLSRAELVDLRARSAPRH